MRTRIKILIIILFLIINTGYGFAQNSNRKIFVAAKQVTLDIREASVDIIGYDGNDLIIEPNNAITTSATDSKLKLLSEVNPENNVISPYIMKNDMTLLSILLPPGQCKHYKIKLPKNINLTLSFFTLAADGKVSISGLSGQLELSGTIPVIEISDISGPLTLSAGQDKNGEGASEKIVLSHIPIAKNPAMEPFFNIISGYANVDISLPQEMKATFQIDMQHDGEIYSDLDIKAIKSSGAPIKNRYNGELNGGGKMITINAGYGNVFIRKQK